MEHARAVLAGRVDVGYTFGLASDFPPDLVAEPLGAEPVTAAMLPSAHPLASAPALTLGALADVPLVLTERAALGGLHDVILSAVRRDGREPRVVAGVTTFAELAQVVAAGAGWALVGSSIAASPPAGTVVRPVADVPPETAIGVFALRRRDAADALAEAFVAVLRERGAVAG
jgi:DNA-binding transcriptional LysR family regulator